VLVDTHCHLGHIEADPAATMDEARAAGVDTVVDVGMGTAESVAAVERSKTLQGVYAAVGIHPNDLSEFEAGPGEALTHIHALAMQPRVVGIGETGLDFYRDRWPPALQEESFRGHIELARVSDRALIIHCRNAHERVLEVLDDSRLPERVIMHCFSGDADYARACGERGYFCSFAGNVSFKNAADLRAAAAAVPSELLLAETDAPFLAPHPFRGRPNAPRLLPHTVEAMAAAVGMDTETLGVVLRRNSARAFALDLS